MSARCVSPCAYVPAAMVVTRAVRELDDVFTLTFEPPNGFSFEAGQFNMMYVYGAGEVAISISGDPSDDRRLVHTVRAVGRVTRAMQALGEGSVLGIRGPYGRGWPLEEARGRDVLFVAGGLGLAPLRSAILRVLANRREYGRVTILVGARSPSSILYREDLQRWRGRFDCDVEVIVDRGDLDWFGDVGVITSLVTRTPVTSDTAVFVCGPEIMMRVVARELERAGVPDSCIWLAMERNMKCAIGLCGHCQFGPFFVCKDGPVQRFDQIASLFLVREV